MHATPCHVAPIQSCTMPPSRAGEVHNGYEGFFCTIFHPGTYAWAIFNRMTWRFRPLLCHLEPCRLSMMSFAVDKLRPGQCKGGATRGHTNDGGGSTADEATTGTEMATKHGQRMWARLQCKRVVSQGVGLQSHASRSTTVSVSAHQIQLCAYHFGQQRHVVYLQPRDSTAGLKLGNISPLAPI